MGANKIVQKSKEAKMKAAMAGMRRCASKGRLRQTANSQWQPPPSETLDSITVAAGAMKLPELPRRIATRVAVRVATRLASVSPPTEPWCMQILRTEAKLRLGPEYITSTSAFFDASAVSPVHLDEAVEVQALREHGLLPSTLLPYHVAGRLKAYRAATRSLPQRYRDEIFFLRANDALFRPCAKVVGLAPSGLLHNVHTSQESTSVRLEEILASLPRALLLASTSS